MAQRVCIPGKPYLYPSHKNQHFLHPIKHETFYIKSYVISVVLYNITFLLNYFIFINSYLHLCLSYLQSLTPMLITHANAFQVTL